MSMWMTYGRLDMDQIFYLVGGYEPNMVLHKHFTVSGQGWFCLEAG